MKKIYSTALFGSGDQYAQYLPAFLLGALNLFPEDEGWRVRVHADDVVMDTRRGAFLACLLGSGLIDLRVMDPAPLTRAMLWRMAPVFEEGVDFVFCRDIDAPPMPRDRAVCERFMTSPASIGTCHDNLAHAGVMGGLCHFRTREFREQSGIHTLEELYKYAAQSDEQWAQHGTDQNVLNRLVSQQSRLVLLEHRFNGWTEGRPGKTDRQAGTYGCKAWSTPTPDKGHSVMHSRYGFGPLFAATVAADTLGNHLGCAGYDHEAARAFWEQHGDRRISNIVAACERVD
jgi:hypothetical protein